LAEICRSVCVLSGWADATDRSVEAIPNGTGCTCSVGALAGGTGCAVHTSSISSRTVGVVGTSRALSSIQLIASIATNAVPSG
jgi:hypothetical protein